MYQTMYDFLVEYMEEHGGMPDGAVECIDQNDSAEERLRTLIGTLCLPENGGVEMVRGILSLEFDPEEVDNLIFESFDMFF